MKTPITNRTKEQCPTRGTFQGLLAGIKVPSPEEGWTPVQYSEALGEAYLAATEQAGRRNGGHYLTPSKIARFMGSKAFLPKTGLRVLDPGSGTGILSCGVCEKAVASDFADTIHIDAYEVDAALSALSELALRFCQQWLRFRGIEMTYNVRQEDFVLAHADVLAEGDPTDTGAGLERLRGQYDVAISNPPYFKIAKDDPRAIAASTVVHGQPNIYALFMAVSSALLSESGRLVFIVPRSFASGHYFRRLREVLFQRVRPKAIHLFESRKDVFHNQTVLQENLIFVAERVLDPSVQENQGSVSISHSRGVDDLDRGPNLDVPFSAVLDLRSQSKELRIPTSFQHLNLVKTIRSWPNTLGSLGLNVSTGPVVPFRATQFLEQHPTGGTTVPLLWMHHIRPMRVEWPRERINKPQWITNTQESVKLLVRDQTYVLLRRFSAKEEKRRLVAAPFVRGYLSADLVGLENHLNYIHGVSRELDQELAFGIAALLNSSLLDQYFRLSSGNTQASATEIREMPLPSEEQIRAIGKLATDWTARDEDSPDLDETMINILALPVELPNRNGVMAR